MQPARTTDPGVGRWAMTRRSSRSGSEHPADHLDLRRPGRLQHPGRGPRPAARPRPVRRPAADRDGRRRDAAPVVGVGAGRRLRSGRGAVWRTAPATGTVNVAVGGGGTVVVGTGGSLDAATVVVGATVAAGAGARGPGRGNLPRPGRRPRTPSRRPRPPPAARPHQPAEQQAERPARRRRSTAGPVQQIELVVHRTPRPRQVAEDDNPPGPIRARTSRPTAQLHPHATHRRAH